MEWIPRGVLWGNALGSVVLFLYMCYWPRGFVQYANAVEYSHWGISSNVSLVSFLWSMKCILENCMLCVFILKIVFVIVMIEGIFFLIFFSCMLNA